MTMTRRNAKNRSQSSNMKSRKEMAARSPKRNSFSPKLKKTKLMKMKRRKMSLKKIIVVLMLIKTICRSTRTRTILRNSNKMKVRLRFQTATSKI
jgi:hypothetical protein